jgi:hypothetical protein
MGGFFDDFVGVEGGGALGEGEAVSFKELKFLLFYLLLI